jgi:hypothetical protein
MGHAAPMRKKKLNPTTHTRSAWNSAVENRKHTAVARISVLFEEHRDKGSLIDLAFGKLQTRTDDTPLKTTILKLRLML